MTLDSLLNKVADLVTDYWWFIAIIFGVVVLILIGYGLYVTAETYLIRTGYLNELLEPYKPNTTRLPDWVSNINWTRAGNKQDCIQKCMSV